MELSGRKIYIAGHTGLVGSALVRYFSKISGVHLLVVPHQELDSTCQQDVIEFLQFHKPDIVINAAGRVGGIHANSKYPAEFIYQNLMIAVNLIHGAWKMGIEKFLNFGSSCIYPKNSPQPMTTDLLMTGRLEPTNEPYAMSKLAGMSLCSAYNKQYNTSYVNVIPSNLYGPGDTFDLNRCHVIAAMIHKFHEAKIKKDSEIILWGSGNVERDFLFIDDFAVATSFLLQAKELPDPINVGAQSPSTIKNLALTLKEIVGFEGSIHWDIAKSDGAPARVLSAPEIQALGWRPTISLKEGLYKTYNWFLENHTH